MSLCSLFDYLESVYSAVGVGDCSAGSTELCPLRCFCLATPAMLLFRSGQTRTFGDSGWETPKSKDNGDIGQTGSCGEDLGPVCSNFL